MSKLYNTPGRTNEFTRYPTQTVKPSPYIAKGPIGNLTQKEKRARWEKKAYVGGNTIVSEQTQFFSPQLSTDFLELPQSLREKREIYRHFYNTDPIVGQAIDLHTELPLSKVRLAMPKPTTFPKGFKDEHDYASYILWFFTQMCEKIKLFQRLVTMVHHYWLDGGVFVFAEDSEVELPNEVGYTKTQIGVKSIITPYGDAVETPEYGYTENPEKDEEELAYYQKKYSGWSKLIILPIDQVKVSTYSFTDTMRIEMIPAERDRALIEQAKAGDEFAMQVACEIPEEVRSYLEEGRLIPLGTDPDEGSFCYYLAGRRGAEEDLGQSILDRVLRTLMYREKLRQAQTQIASRAMTPKRLVWADRISAMDVEDLREQVDLALVDPDYSIITNYEVRWEEMGARDRLLDLSSEYDITDRQLYAGLGVTESLLSGEAMYSGDRLKLEVINTRYLFLREMVQEYVENYLFKPVARRKGFVEKNSWGGEVVIYPKLSFTRLPLRDSQDTYDALFNLYQKGSIDIGVILEMFNIDPEDTKQRLEKDLFTVNDAMFNEVVRGIYNDAGSKLVESSDVVEKIADALKVAYSKPVESDDRF